MMRGDTCPTFVDGLAERIEQKYVFEFHKGPIVQRQKLNETLTDTLGRVELMVVLGQRQAGKSTLVQSWLSGRSNVYHYSPKDGDKLVNDDRKVCGPEYKYTLIGALRKVRKTADQPAIVAFEINHDTKNEAITGIYESLKQIVFDSQLPHTKGLLVLSNSYAIDAFPADHGRYETIWVGHLTEDEAKEFIKTKKTDVNDAEQYVQGLNATGLHMGQLEAALRKKSLDAWKAMVVEEVRLAAARAQTREIMRRLPKSPEGVKWQHLGLGDDGAKLIEQARGDVWRVVVYSAGPDRFHWASPEHYEAWNKTVAREHWVEKDEL